MIKVAPSILSADFVNLERDIRSLPAAGADYVHVDVMDGMFVPNITIGIPVVAAISRIATLPLDVHLMIERPIRRIRENGVRAAISVKPNTPAEAVLPFLPLCDLILVMTVEPGFGGQSFLHSTMPKLHRLRQWIDEQNPACELEVDGGVNVETAKICRDNGANVLVAGSAYFKAADPAAFVRAVKA